MAGMEVVAEAEVGVGVWQLDSGVQEEALLGLTEVEGLLVG